MFKRITYFLIVFSILACSQPAEKTAITNETTYSQYAEQFGTTSAIYAWTSYYAKCIADVHSVAVIEQGINRIFSSFFKSNSRFINKAVLKNSLYLQVKNQPEIVRKFDEAVEAITSIVGDKAIGDEIIQRIINSSSKFISGQNSKSSFDDFLNVLKKEVDEIAKSGIVETSGRQTWNGFANIFKASVDEISEAANRIKTHRLTAPNGGNYGYIEGNVNNMVIDNKIWRSGGANLQTEPQIFTAIPVEGSSGATWLRNTDSEYKMLNKLASDLGGTSGAIKPNVTGELKIISENQYCESCTGIIQQFHSMFPNVKLILVDGVK